MSVEPAGSVARLSGQRLSLPLRLLAGVMRSLPTDIRRVEVIWQSLYARIGGGGFAPEEAVDQRWPRGLQDAIRGNHRLRMRLNLQNWSDRRAYFSGRYYQPDICRLLEQMLRPGDQYVDVGANVGMTALLARSRIGPAGKGLAFEPNPTAFARLRDHFEMNGVTNFQLVPCAVADRESVQQLFVPLDEMLLGTFVPEKAEGTRVEVRTMPADSYVAALNPSKPTLIKIDVEGYEVQVLHGIRSLLARPDVMVVIEIADAKLRAPATRATSCTASWPRSDWHRTRFTSVPAGGERISSSARSPNRSRSTNMTLSSPGPGQNSFGSESNRR